MAITLDGTSGITTPGVTNTGTDILASSDTNVFQYIRSTSTGTTNVALRIQDGTTGTTTGDGIYLGRASAVNYLWTYENEPWVFATNNTERMRIDASGNVGLGGTTNAYGSQTTFTLSGTNVSRIDFRSNNVFTGTILSYQSVTEGLRLQTEANYPITFYPAGIERMRLDASGNLGVGITSPLAGYRGHFVDTRAVDSVAVGVRNLSSSGITRFVLGNDIGYARFTIGYNGSIFASNPSTAWLGTEGTEPLWFKTNDAARLWITSAGYIGVNTSTPETNGAFCIRRGVTTSAMTNCSFSTSDAANSTFDVGHPSANLVALSAQGSSLAFWAGSAERARFDNNGNFFIGKTSQSVGNGFSYMPNMYGTGIGLVDLRGNSTSNNDTIIQAYRTANSTYAFFIQWSGQIYSTSTSILSTSDASLKQNIRPLETGLSEILALQPRRFDWIDGRAQDVAGFVAQEVQPFLPDLIENAKFRENDDGTSEYKLSIRMSDMIPTMVKAIQEQQALITQLTARITALEGGNP